MKKLLLLSIICCMFVVVGCGAKEKRIELKNVKIAVNESDEEGIFRDVDTFKFGDYKPYERKKAKSSQSVKINGKQVTGNYVYSYEDPMLNYGVDVYADEAGNSFELSSETKTLVGYSDEGRLLETLTFSSKEEMLKCTDAFASDYIDTKDFEPYINTQVLVNEEGISSSRNEEGFYVPKENEEANYVVTYIYTVKGVKTFERFEINIYKGRISSFYYIMPGEYTDSKVTISYDDADLKAVVDDFIKANATVADLKYQIKDTYLSVNSKGKNYIMTILDVSYPEEGAEHCKIVNLLLELE